MSYNKVGGCKDWTETIATGGIVEAVDINEFKTNVDWIKDNLACLSHNSTVRATHYSADDSGHNGTYNATHYTTYQATNDSAEKALHNSVYKVTNYTGDLSSHYDQNYNNHDVGYDATYNATHQNAIESSYLAEHNITIQWINNSSHYPGDDALENINNNTEVNNVYCPAVT
jgi:hypothetical protein